MKRSLVPRGRWLESGLFAGAALAHAPSPVSVEIVDAGRRTCSANFRVDARDGALRSYLQAEKGARYQVRVRNTTGERLGLVIAVDGRNIINGAKSDLARSEPMYVLDAWATQDYAGWRANLDAINEFYFTDWSDSYAEAFGDRSARGVIAVAVYRRSGAAAAGVPAPGRTHRSADAADAPAASAAPPAARRPRRGEIRGHGLRRPPHRSRRASRVRRASERRQPSLHQVRVARNAVPQTPARVRREQSVLG